MEISQISQIINNDPLSAEGYRLLGDYLLTSNAGQSYLCYENALFYSKNAKEQEELTGKLELMRGMNVAVAKAAIIILSYNLKEDIRVNIESIRSTTPESAREIIVVDNASTDDSVEYLEHQPDVILQANSYNAGFPKGCNQGIELASKDSDIFLLNNDTIMMPNTLFWLRMGLYDNDKVGAAGCVTNNIFGEQKICEAGLSREWYEEYSGSINRFINEPLKYTSFIVGFALIVKRSVLDKIGVLDEIYSPGNYEDNDYCLRIWEAGYRTAIVRNSFLVHVGGKSFGKRPDYSEILHRNKMAMENKFGIGNTDSLMHPDKMLTEVVSQLGIIAENANVLEVNFRLGAFITDFKYKNPGCHIEGVSASEISRKYGMFTDEVALQVFEDKSEYINALADKKYDLIIINISVDDAMGADFYFEIIRKHLVPGGKVVIALENCHHYSMWLPLITGRKPSKEISANVITVSDIQNALPAGLGISYWGFITEPEKDFEQAPIRDELVRLMTGKGVLERDLMTNVYYIGIQ